MNSLKSRNLKPIDPLLIKASQSPPGDPVRIRGLGWLIIQASIVLAVSMFFSISIGTSMLPTFGDFSIEVQIPDYLIGEVERGDIVSIHTNGRKLKWINKRVIALPGETISIADGVVSINGVRLKETYLPKDHSQTTEIKKSPSPKHTEAFLTGCENSGRLELLSKSAPYRHIWECRLSPDHVFVLGDNRAASTDSREIGPVHVSRIEAQKIFTLYPFSKFGLV